MAMNFARALDPEAPCVRSFEAAEAQAEKTALMLRIVGGLFVLAAFAIGFFFIRFKLAGVAAIRKNEPLPPERDPEGEIARRIAPAAFSQAFGDALARTERAIREEDTPEATATADALVELGPSAGALAREVQSAARAALSTGRLETRLLHFGDLAVYALVFPRMDDQPQAFRRHDGMGDGWSPHVRALESSLGASRLPERVLSLFVFLRPDVSETALVVGYDAPERHYLPFGVIDPSERQGGQQGTHREEWAFSEGALSEGTGA
jgi:hypothetical protein